MQDIQGWTDKEEQGIEWHEQKCILKPKMSIMYKENIAF